MRAILERGVLAKIPLEGSISAKDLATSVGADEMLSSQSRRLSLLRR